MWSERRVPQEKRRVKRRQTLPSRHFRPQKGQGLTQPGSKIKGFASKLVRKSASVSCVNLTLTHLVSCCTDHKFNALTLFIPVVLAGVLDEERRDSGRVT